MKLILQTVLGNIHIALRENSFVTRWLDHFQWMLATYPSCILFHPFPGCLDVENLHPEHQQDLESNIQLLVDSVARLNDLGTNFPLAVDVSALRGGGEAGQQMLNGLHRCFTNSFRTLNSRRSPYSWSSDGHSTFTVADSDMKIFTDASANINTGVHNLEKYMINGHKRAAMINPCSRASFYFDAYTASADSSILSRDAAQHIQVGDYDFFSDDRSYDVWVGKDVLGKDYMTAFLENDDPREWDVTRLIYYTGRLEIDLTPYTFADRLASPEFLNWLAQHGMEYRADMVGMPLGRVVQGRELLQPLIDQGPRPAITGITIT